MPRRTIGLIGVLATLLALPGALGLLSCRLALRERGNQRASIVVGGRTRRYIVHAPKEDGQKKPLALVLVLHGASQSAESAERMSGMDDEADREGFLAVYPSGTSRFGFVPTWNAGACCGYAMDHNVDDVAFLRELISALRQDHQVDPKRVYVTGISNGAMMAYRLACELSDQIAAIAPVEGAPEVDCHPAAPVSLIAFHGTKDRLVPFDGGTTSFQLGSRRSDPSVPATISFWARQNGCAPIPKRDEETQAVVESYENCAEGSGVTLYTIPGGRHMWPGLRISGNSVPATDLMWSFFKAHPKP